MTEKQPDWIDKIWDKFKIHMGYYGDLGKPYLRELIESNLPQESTYESGYQKGKEEMEDKIEKLRDHWEGIKEEDANNESDYDRMGEFIEDLDGILSPTDTK